MQKKYIRFLAGIVVLLSFCLTLPSVYSQNLQKITVFKSGEDGYQSFRIPAIIEIKNGDLLAFAEGRVKGASDFGHINIVMKRSSDKGKTWSKLSIVASNNSLQAGNAAPVEDRMDPKYPNGRIFLFYNTGDTDEGNMRKARGIRRVLYRTSADGGLHWGVPVDITDQASKIQRPDVNPQWNHPQDWRSYANTPGHGLQIQQGPYKGRLFIAANHSEGTPKSDYTDYIAHGYFTDDHGTSFTIGDNLPVPGSNESTAAELAGGDVMINSRNQRGHIRERIVGVSSSGGKKWDSTYFDTQLPDPICEGSILTVRYGKKSNTLAFCNDASIHSRDSLTLRISYNDGKTWAKHILIDSSNSAYSDIVSVDRKNIGILYEADGYQKIIFTKLNWTEIR